MTGRLVAAVDLGASSGRVMVGRVGTSELELTEVHGFPNEPVRPSATSDIELQRVEGVHGPRRLDVVFVED